MRTRLFILLLFSINTLAMQAQSKAKRAAQVDTILSQTEQYICNPHFLQTPEWEEFVTTIRAAETLKLNDSEFARLFNQASRKLPFTHYYLNYTGGKAKGSQRPPFSLEEINTTTAVIHISTWAKDAAAMINVVQEIEAKAYAKLIIDLRDNTGGTLDAAVILGQYLTKDSIDTGTYLTRAWFEQTADYPDQEQLNSFPFLKDMSFEGFGAMMQNPGFRMVVPGHDSAAFDGELVVLINENTASTNEPLVHIIQQKDLGTLVGQQTAGAMMSGRFFKISKKLRLFMPVADYVTAEGIRLDKVGVQPDVEVPSAQAMQTALKMLDIEK